MPDSNAGLCSLRRFGKVRGGLRQVDESKDPLGIGGIVAAHDLGVSVSADHLGDLIREGQRQQDVGKGQPAPSAEQCTQQQQRQHGDAVAHKTAQRLLTGRSGPYRTLGATGLVSGLLAFLHKMPGQSESADLGSSFQQAEQ